MASCPHGFESGTCLICSTLGTDVKATKTGTAKIPAGKPEVVRGRPAPRRGVGILGGLVIILLVVVAGWFVLGLIRGILRLVELALVGLVCGYVGFRIGVWTGRHRRSL